MLTSSDKLFSAVKIDYKRIELLRKASIDKSIKITPALLTILDDCENIDKLFATPSTSTTVADYFGLSRRVPKRRFEEEFLTSEESCKKCGCRMLRSVDTGRPDGKMVLECMRANCLASVNLTELPVGTVVGTEANTQKEVFECYAGRDIFVNVPGQEKNARMY
uniref:Uncharacterized protein n=1 Tax=Caenorhabditis japonica TaxID=281687 RepID=A0A8R1HN20_CAEJA